MSKEEDSFVASNRELLGDLGKGIVAGLVATLVVLILFLVQRSIGLVPAMDVIAVWNMFIGASWSGTGWLIVCAGGLVLGAFFAALDAHLEAAIGFGEMARGLLFSLIVWLLFMLLFMPKYGGGIFGLGLGIGAPIVTFVAAVLYGLVLGAVYGGMHPKTVS